MTTLVTTPFRVSRSTRSSRVAAWAMIPVLGVLIAMPYLLSSGVQQGLTQLFILMIMGTMWNLLAGYAGLVSIGQQAFIGIGAYGLVASANNWGVNPFLAILIGVALAAVLSYPISFLVFRLYGGYFAIGTWVVSEVVMQVVSRVPAFGGGPGMNLRPMGLGPNTRIAYIYWVALAAVILAVAVTYLLMRSRLGTGFTAIRDDTVAAGSLGVQVTRAKRIVYVVAAGGSALAGGLMALSTLQVKPDSMFSIGFTVSMIFIVLIGGMGTIEGPIVGAVVYFALQQLLSGLGAWYLVILGVVAVVIAIALPRGLWGLLAARGIRLFPVGHRVELDFPTRSSVAPER